MKEYARLAGFGVDDGARLVDRATYDHVIKIAIGFVATLEQFIRARQLRSIVDLLDGSRQRTKVSELGCYGVRGYAPQFTHGPVRIGRDHDVKAVFDCAYRNDCRTGSILDGCQLLARSQIDDREVEVIQQSHAVIAECDEVAMGGHIVGIENGCSCLVPNLVRALVDQPPIWTREKSRLPRDAILARRSVQREVVGLGVFRVVQMTEIQAARELGHELPNGT